MYTYNALVLHVVDGDTVDLDIDLGLDVHHQIRVRLLGINAPEMHGPLAAAGVKSRDWLRAQIEGQQILAVTVKDKQEKYGRYLATLMAAGGMNINQQMIQLGLAAAYNP